MTETLTFPRTVPKERDFRQLLEGLAHTRGSIVPVFADFCRMVACAVAAGGREPEYMATIEPYSRDDLTVFSKAFALLVDEMEASPFADILGPYYTEINSAHTRGSRGEFFTPPAIADLMGQLSFDADAVRAAGRPVTIGDPAAGSGGLVLACARALKPDIDLMRVTLQDINPTACDMAYINMTLWGIPAEIILGNTLTMDEQQRWTNVHWHRVGEDLRRTFAGLAARSPVDRDRSPTPSSVPTDDGQTPDQQEFDFTLE